MAVGTRVVARQMVGGQRVKISIGGFTGRADVRVRMVEPWQRHRRHPHHVFRAPTALEAGRWLARAADEGAVFAQDRCLQVDTTGYGVCHALALERGNPLLDRRQ